MARATSADANETCQALLNYYADRPVEVSEPLSVIPFSSSKKWSGASFAQGSYVMGAAQFVLSDRVFSQVENRVAELADTCRVLVVARVAGFTPDGDMVGEAEPVGFVTIRDEIRTSAAETIGYFNEQGVTLNVISGDDPRTVSSIARVVGVPGADAYVDATTLDTPAKLDAAVDRYHVFGRVTPQQKRELVQALKRREHTVAMTGDGVNDAPSIKRADIGVGMGITGTDVTKNVADMVLADDNFATIIGACEEGRRIYDNIRKVIQFLLSANLAEVFSVFIATLIGFTIFQPVQLLWVNLVTDCFPALALGMEDAEGDIMKRKPRNAKDGVFAGHMGLDCVVQGLIITVLVLASFFVGVYFDMGYIHIADMIAGNADEEGVMMAFITLNMVEIFHCFNMRSRRASLFTMKKQNKWLWASAALALVLTVIVTVQPTLAEMFFGPVTLELKGVLAALGLAFLIIPLMEIYKAIMRAVEKE